MRRVWRIIAALMVAGMMCCILGVIALALVFKHYDQGLPDFKQLEKYEPAITTRLYASDGKLLAEYAKEKRIFVPLKAIPKRVTEAFVAAEDRNFYDHQGVDIWGIARAVKENAANYGSGKSMVGGSTITQQVVKNFLLTNEKSLERKIKEAILAYRISNAFSKDKILELYLNEIYLGIGSYGVAAASLNYFNKPLDELTTEEIAFLAGLPKAPANYDPNKNYQKAVDRRNYVLTRMEEDGFITSEEGDKARAAPIVLRNRESEEVASADFFAEEVRRKLMQMYGDNVLYEGGLSVMTTVNPEYQAMADRALRKALTSYDRRHGYRGPLKHYDSTDNWQVTLQRYQKDAKIPLFDGQQVAMVLGVEANMANIGTLDGKRGHIPLAELTWARKELPHLTLGPAITKVQDVLSMGDVVLVAPLKDSKEEYALQQIPEVNGAMVVIDPHTGRVLAMSGGYSYGGTEFNRATQAKRQPGSAFKPFAYLTALENGFTPSSMLVDAPIELYQGPGLPMWKPENFEESYLGPATLRMGLEKSRNTMTVRLAQRVGIKRILRMAKRFGIFDDAPKQYSMVLGAQETTLLKLANAYAMIANGGKRVESSIIERIDDRHGKAIFKRDNRECKQCLIEDNNTSAEMTPPLPADNREIVLDQRIAYQMTEVMEGVVQRGTATAAKVLARPVAGKTGTTNDSRDTWFIGFTPDLVCGVYIGFDTPRPMGGKETGGRVALPGFIDFMQQALKDEPAKAFPEPEGVFKTQVYYRSGRAVDPAFPEEGQVITETFLEDGEIYKPPLPEGEEDDEPLMVHEEGQGAVEVEDNFDPYQEWNTNHPDSQMMTPEQWRDRFQQPMNTPPYGVSPDGHPVERGGSEHYGTGGLY